MLYGNVVFGTTPVATSPVTVTLTAPSSRVKARATLETDLSGRFTALFGVDFSEFDALSERIEPGDRIAVEWSRDDPAIFDVPALTVETRPAEGLVVGSAPPGTRVEAERAGTWLEAVTGVDGRYAIPLGGSVALARGDFGAIRFHVKDRLVIDGTWLAPKLVVTSQLGFSVAAPAGRQIAIEFRDRDGALLDRSSVYVASDTIGGSVRGYSFDLNRLGGGRLALMPGDVIEATIGDDVVATRVVAVTAAASPERDVVEGLTEPGRSLHVGALKRTDSGAVAREVLATTSDQTGAFGVDFSGLFDITFGNQVDIVVADEAGHVTVTGFSSPHLQIDLDSGTLSGSVAPESPVHVALTRDRAVLGEAQVRADANGRFSAPLLASDVPDGAIEPGDAVVATLPDGSAPMIATIPSFTLEVEPPSRRIAGRSAPGAQLDLYVWSAFVGSGGYGVATPTANAVGSYSYTVPPSGRGGWDFHPGTIVQAQQPTVEGHHVVRSWREPLVSAEIGGARTCGLALPSADVSLELLDSAGVRLGGASTRADTDGYWDVVLRDADGAPVAVPIDHRLRMTIDRASEDTVVPPLAVAAEWAAPDARSGLTISVLRGTMAPAAPYWLFGGSDGCMTGRTMPFGVTVRQERSSIDGTFLETFQQHARGDATLVATSSPGHRAFAEARRGRVTVFKGTADFEAIGSPGAPLELGVRRAGVGIVAEHRGQLDALGRAAAMIDSPASGFAFADGDEVAVAFGDDAATFRVSSVDVDLQAGGFVAAAPAGEPLEVSIVLGEGDPLQLSLAADERGMLRVAFAALLQRTGLDGTAVLGVTVAHVTSSGHRAAVMVAPGRDPENARAFTPFALSARYLVAPASDTSHAVKPRASSCAAACAHLSNGSRPAAQSPASTCQTARVQVRSRPRLTGLHVKAVVLW